MEDIPPSHHPSWWMHMCDLVWNAMAESKSLLDQEQKFAVREPLTIYQRQKSIVADLVVDTFVGVRIPYDGKARAFCSRWNRQGLLPWFRGAVSIYHSYQTGVRVYDNGLVGPLKKRMLSLTLIVDTDNSSESYSSNAWRGIQDDIERMEVSAVPAIPALVLRVSILL